VKRIIYRSVLFAERRAWFVIATVGILTAVFGWFAVRIQADTNISNLVPESRDVQSLTERYGTGNVQGEYLMLLFLDPELFTARKLDLVAGACDQVAALQGIQSSITPFNFLMFENRGGRVALGSMSPGGKAPATDSEAVELRKRLLDDPQSRNLVISGDGTAVCAIFPVGPIDDHRPLLNATQRIIEPLKSQLADVRISGMIPVNQALMDSLYRDLPTFLVLALLVILVSYFLSFRTLRSLILPILVVVVGTLWTVGTMTLLAFVSRWSWS